MKIILIENVKGTGKKDEIKEVKDGFGNFLIKNKKAVLYSLKSKEVLASELKERKEKEDALLKEMQELKKRIELLELIFKVKTGSNGRVFGSISGKQISEELKHHKIDVDKKLIETNNINTLGTHIVKVNLHKKVIADLRVTLKGED